MYSQKSLQYLKGISLYLLVPNMGVSVPLAIRQGIKRVWGGLLSKLKKLRGNGTFRKGEVVEVPHSTEFFDGTKIMLTHSDYLVSQCSLESLFNSCE